MNINIALNTIIYIMVFLFPGLLFRRAFFSGKFNKHFESGNNVDRFLWNILCSLIIILVFCVINIFGEYWFEKNMCDTFGISAQEILNDFISIYENKFPISLKDIESIKSVSFIVGTIYVIAFGIGYSLNKFIFILGLEKKYAILKFQNHWDYLTNSNKQNNIQHKLGDAHYTKVDVKTNDNELFTGKLHEIIFDKEGKIYAVAMQDTYKFCKLEKDSQDTKIAEIRALLEAPNNANFLPYHESESDFIYKKRIKGNVFTINENKISNISITYIVLSRLYARFQKTIKITVSVLLLLMTLFSISYGIWDFHIIDFATSYKRIGFCFITPFVLLSFILTLIKVFNTTEFRVNRVKYRTDIIIGIAILLFFLIPYLYVFDYIKFYVLLVVIGVSFFSIVILFNKINPVDNNNQNRQ